MSCKDNCGPITTSCCIPFTGKDLTIVAANTLKCDANIDDVIFQIDKVLKSLADANDLTGLIKHSLDFDPATITPAELHQVEIDAIDILQGKVTSLETQLANLNIGAEVITIDLPTCLEEDASPCATGTNQYQLIAILNLFAAKLCDHESRILNLE